jgi:hypothetical protein
MRGCTAQYFQAAMGVDSLKACETRRIELILRHCCSMRVKLFLGRGQKAKWFVLQQPLIFSQPVREHQHYCRLAFGCI